MGRMTNTTPRPPWKAKDWPQPQMTLPQPAPNQPSVNGSRLPPAPNGGGNNP